MIAPQEVVDAFTFAATTALQELVSIEAIPEPLASKEIVLSNEDLVSSQIELQRDPPGTMTLLLGADTATQLATRYLPPSVEVTAEMIEDVAGEFANVIAGQAKTMLKGTPFHFHLSTPQVTRPRASTQSPIAKNSAAILLFGCELGPVILVVDLPPSSRPMS